MTAYLDSRLRAAIRVDKIRNDIRADLPAAAGLLVLGSVLFGLSRGAGLDAVWFGATVLVVVLVQLPLLLWSGADLRPAEIELHGFGRRRIAWHQVQAMSAEKTFRGVRIVLWTFRGERIPLRAPTISAWGSGRRRFAENYLLLERYWLTYRGPAGPPGPNAFPAETARARQFPG